MNEDQHINRDNRDHDDIDQELLRQLEQATAPSSLVQETELNNEFVDSETRPLRQAWLAFGSLLDAAQSLPSTAITSTAILVELPPPRSRAQWWTVSAALAAVAAVILLAVTLRWSAPPATTEPSVAGPNSEFPNSEFPNSDGEEDGDAEEDSSFQAEEPAPRLALDDASLDDASEDLLAWDDGFDDQLSQVSQAVLAADERWYQLDAPFDMIQTQLEKFDDQFAKESL